MNKELNTKLSLSPRLYAISQLVKPGWECADIGADHAQLPLFLLEQSLVPKVIVTDIARGPYERAEMAVQASPWADKIDLLLGDGLEPLQPGEVGTVIIAGLGGDTIVDIISRDWKKAESFPQYILQPMSRAWVLRNTLAERGWPITTEKVVQEESRFFLIINTCPGTEPYSLSPLEADIGPLILSSPVENGGYLNTWLNKYRKIIDGLGKAGRQNELAAVQEKLCELEDRIHGA